MNENKTINPGQNIPGEPAPSRTMPLGKLNFIFMGVAGVLIIVGFLLMLGGSSSPEEFNPDIFSTRRIVVGPAVAFIGFVAMTVAIIVHPKRNKK